MSLALAVDLGGTKIEACLVDPSGAVVAGTRTREATGPDSDAESLATAVRAVVHGALAALPAGAAVVGAGIGSAGPVDTTDGTIAPLNLPGAAGFPLAAAVRDAARSAGHDVPVTLALDGQCIALAESWFGAGRGARSVLGMVVSTGIGGGIVVDGRPLAGSTGNAGHIGQVEVAGFTDAGVGGLDATVERIASGPNIVRWARAQGWEGRTGEDLAAGYTAGDRIAVAAVRRSAAAVGAALASASALLDVDVFIIGGGFSGVSTDYVDLVREARDSGAAFPFLTRAAIVRAQLGSDSPLIGAASLVLGLHGE
jgi:glucokinase